MTTKFKAGQKYMMLNQPVMVIRRTEKTVWFDFYGETFSRRIKLLENKEYVDYDQHHSIFSTITHNETTTESQDNVETLKGWEYINKQAEYENRRNPYYAVFSNLSTANYNGEFYGLYFQKIYNWIDEKTSKQLDVFVTEFKDIDPNKHYINFYYRAMDLYQKTPIGNPNKTTPEPTKVAVTEPKVKSLIVCDRKAISDVVYSELIEAFNLKDDECLPAWCGFYRYEKPKKSMTEPCVYFVFYEHVNGRSGGNYQVKVTFDEPCTTVETPQDVAETTETTSEPSQDLATESQTFNHFEYIESHYVTRNPPGSENIYTEVPGGWNTLKSVAFTLITAWENECLDMTVQHWITGLTREELDTLLSVLVSMFSHAKIKSSQVNQIILGLMPTPVIVSSETQIDDETYAGILKAFDLDIYCGESVKQGHREYFAPVPRFDIEPDMYYIVSADIGEEYDTIFSVKKINPTPLTHNAPNNVIEVDFAARKRV